MSKKMGLIIILCTLLFGGYYYIYSNSFLKSVTSFKIDGKSYKLGKNESVVFSDYLDGVYYNENYAGKKLEVFKDIEIGDDIAKVVEDKLQLEDDMAYVTYKDKFEGEDFTNYYKDEIYFYNMHEQMTLTFGFKVSEGEVIVLDYYDIYDIVRFEGEYVNNDVILYNLSFERNEDNYRQEVTGIEIYYFEEGEKYEK